MASLRKHFGEEASWATMAKSESLTLEVLSMKSNILLFALGIFAMVLGACGPRDGGDGNLNNNSNTPGCPDADGDGICDADEGRAQSVDTDGDGTPDYLDLDSDDDGIADSVERGLGQPGSYPVDSDGDGIPDFRDEDSDDNGIPDSMDGVADLDGDSVGNYADMDDDGDGIGDASELQGMPYAPPDSDGDGIPDYHDTDSDGDTILDLHEGGAGFTDTDEDTLSDYLDLDSDNDGIPDSIEAGDASPETRPVDSDADGIPDYRDLDSDNDGLPDHLEDLNGNGVLDPGESDPRDDDTDGDGVTDLIEVAAGTDPQDPVDNPQAWGNFVFVVPYEEATDPLQDTLEFRTSVQFADLYFMIDRTGSMSAEFTALSTGLPQIISELTCVRYGTACLLDSDCPAGQVCFGQECIQDPLEGAGCVADLWTGMGRFDNCNTNMNLVSLQSDPTVTANAFAGVAMSGGTEAVYQSAACVADPSLCTNAQSCSTTPGAVGCPGYRSDAVRVLIHVTDAGNQGSACMSDVSIAGNALQAAGIKYVGLYGTSDDGGSPCSTAQSCLTNLGIAAGTLNTSNLPFIYAALDSAVVAATKQGVLELVRGVPLNVTIGAADLPDDDGDALQFIDYLVVNLLGPGNCTNVSPTADTDSDGHQDSFPTLLGGTPVCWDVHPIPLNNFVPATAVPQVFKARLTVYGDGSPLDNRDVYFLIPPVIQGPIGPG